MSDEVVTEPEVKTVDQAAYDQVKNDMFKFKRESQAKDDEVEKLRKQLEDRDNADKAAQGKYKDLWEAAEAKAKANDDKLKEFTNAVIEDKKLARIRELAIQKGINKDNLDVLGYLDTSPVVVETTDQGNFNILGAEQFVETLAQNKPSWFGPGEEPNVNNQVGGFDNEAGTYSLEQLKKLEKEDPAKYKEAIMAISKDRSLLKT